MRLCIGIPCYDGAHPLFLQSLSELYLLLMEHKIPFGIMNMKDSLIPRARNRIANGFLEAIAAGPDDKDMGPFTDLLQLDTDIHFHAPDMMRLIMSPYEVVGGTYPVKNLDWAAIQHSFIQGKSIEDARLSGTRYVTNFQAKPTFIQKDGKMFEQRTLEFDEWACCPSKDTGTGLLRIKASAFQKLIDSFEREPHYWELRVPHRTSGPDSTMLWDSVHQGIYRDDMPGHDFGKKRYNFFGDFVDLPEGESSYGRFLSEDYAFCRRVQAVGIQTYTCLVKAHHIGEFPYEGNLARILQSLHDEQKEERHDTAREMPAVLNPESAACPLGDQQSSSLPQ